MKKRWLSILLLIAVVSVAAVVRTVDYKNTSLDYDEHKTIIDELRLIDREHLLGYVSLRNLWDYRGVNKNHIGVNNSICFPLYYIPLKAISLLSADLAAFRLATIAWGVLSVALFYVLGDSFGKQVSWIGFALMLFHPWVQHHTLHIRFYECWAALVIGGLLYVNSILPKIKSAECGTLHWILLPVVVLLPSAVHAFGTVNLLFIVTYVIIRIRRDGTSLRGAANHQWLLMALSFVVVGVVIAGNIASFGYATLMDGQADDWNNSGSVLQIWGSFIFNSGYLLPLLIAASLTLAFGNASFDTHGYLLDIAVALTISVLPVMVITSLKPNAFRADFLYGILPYVLLMAALAVDKIGNIAFQGRYATATKCFLTIVVIASTLPTFLSNVFIDKDRLPHDIAAVEISGMPNAEVFAPNPNYFNYYLKGHRVHNIQHANRKANDSGLDEYFYIPVRKGMSTQYFYDFRSINGLRLLRILGKDRIDLRSNHIYVFLRKAGFRVGELSSRDADFSED